MNAKYFDKRVREAELNEVGIWSCHFALNFQCSV